MIRGLQYTFGVLSNPLSWHGSLEKLIGSDESREVLTYTGGKGEVLRSLRLRDK